MSRAALPALAAVAAALALVVLVLPSDDSSGYRLRMPLVNAQGLHAGSGVAVGGVRIGKVAGVHVTQPGDQVVADLDIKRASAPVGKDVSATITAVNLLGQKQVQLAIGNRSDPAPSGFEIPSARVTPSTDLADVLNVLEPDVRARLGVFIKEAGIALGGRKTDLSRFLDLLPHGVAELSQLLNDLVSDNHTLRNALENSSAFVASLNHRSRDTVRLVRSVRQAAGAVSSRRSELLQTLDRAPGALTTLRAFLAKLEAATVPLRPAARAITATAQPLTTTLAGLEPFRRAAAPTLREATRVAPALTKLADGATPVLERARPATSALAEFSTQAAPPTGRILDGSIDNIIAIVANWAHAIQARDRLSHIFRGEVAVSAEAIRSAIGRVELLQRAKDSRRRSKLRHLLLPAPQGGRALRDLPRPSLPAVKPPLKVKLPPLHLPSGTRRQDGSSSGSASVRGLLDYLLGP